MVSRWTERRLPKTRWTRSMWALRSSITKPAMTKRTEPQRIRRAYREEAAGNHRAHDHAAGQLSCNRHALATARSRRRSRGEDGRNDESAVVKRTTRNRRGTITFPVAPAVIFYNVYETESTTEPEPVVLADGSENTVTRAPMSQRSTKKVPRISSTNSTAPFYSKMTMSFENGEAPSINADNEGLDSEMHLIVNSGHDHHLLHGRRHHHQRDGVTVCTNQWRLPHDQLAPRRLRGRRH